MPKIHDGRVPIVIGVVGSRRRISNEDFRLCLSAIENVFMEGDTFVSGGCETGGDRFIEILARARGWTLKIHYPAWRGPSGNGAFDRTAGFVRNSNIAEDCSILIALYAEDRTGGTEDTVKKAIKLGKEIIYA